MKRFIQIENDLNEVATFETTRHNEGIIRLVANAIANNCEIYCHVTIKTGEHYPTTYGKRHYVRKQDYYGMALYIHEPPSNDINEPYGTGYKAFDKASQAIHHAIDEVLTNE